MAPSVATERRKDPLPSLAVHEMDHVRRSALMVRPDGPERRMEFAGRRSGKKRLVKGPATRRGTSRIRSRCGGSRGRQGDAFFSTAHGAAQRLSASATAPNGRATAEVK